MTLADNIENLTLTGTAALNANGNASDNVITGNAGANLLQGFDGNDTLDGGAGIDILVGGTGNDIYYVDNKKDQVKEAVGEGTDTVYSTVAFKLTANIENLTLLGSLAIAATGNELNNVIVGNNGANSIDGGLGADTMSGGLGNDTYIVNDAGDVVNENEGEGLDLVKSSVTFALSSTVENLTLTGTAAINGTGNASNNTLIGNAAANTLTGLDGNDTIDGGAGADTMIGGTGNDTYTVDNAGDVVTELADEGTDTVRSSIAYTLSSTVENLTLIGTGSVAGTGNALDNTLIGNAGANTLSGLGGNDIIDGGKGADTMLGGAGDDIYYVDNVGDSVTENASEGTDLVRSTVSFTLGANIENLTFTGSAGTTGTGNALDNELTGNSGVNTLYGLDGNDIIDGGKGADKMYGGNGNDTYYVDNAGDLITEVAGQGTDEAFASVTYTIGANVENLTLTGAANINGTGNASDNVIMGNAGKNVLTGLAGNDTLDGAGGADTMVGGLGDDSYYVDNALDIVTELSGEGTDTVYAKVSYVLSANVENIVLTGVHSIDATGNASANTLTGNEGNNMLDGAAGADTAIGGDGDDTYVVDNASDVTTELRLSRGWDTVRSSITLDTWCQH
ncbi:MAG: calcium-binding protein [Hyphomicrobiales bacterium]